MYMGTLDRIKRLSEQGDRGQAQKELVAFLRSEPRNVDAWWMLAQVLLDPRKKIEAYRHILNLDPDHMEAARQFAVLTLPPGQPLEDSEEYQRALAEYYRKQEELPPVPEPNKPSWLPNAEVDDSPQSSGPPGAGSGDQDKHKPPVTSRSPLENVQRAFPLQQPRHVGELDTESPPGAEEPISTKGPTAFDPVTPADDSQAEATGSDRVEYGDLDPSEPQDALVEAKKPNVFEGAAEPGVEEDLEDQVAAGAGGEGPNIQATAVEDVDSKPLGEDDYPEDFKDALENMRLQGGLRRDGPKPSLSKAVRYGLNPNTLRTNFVRDALGSTAERRIQDLADGQMDSLLPLDEEERATCPNCQATIAKNAEKCEWCGEKIG